MLMLLCLLILVEEPPFQWKADDLEIYTPINQMSTAVTANGNTFILQFREAEITMVDRSGQVVKTFGGKGSGPGEMQNAFIMYSLGGDRVYVQDMRRTHEFDQDGNFIKTHQVVGVHDLRRVKGGWIATKRSFSRQAGEAKDNEMFWYDANLENPKPLFTFPNSGIIFSPDMKFKYNPAPERQITAYSHDGARIMVRLPGESKLHLLSGETGEVLEIIELEIPRKPFDKEWGEKIFNRMKERASRSQATYIPDYPEYFPTIQDVSWVHEGGFSVSSWNIPMQVDAPTWDFDPNGGNTKHKYPRSFSTLGVHNDIVVVSDWDEEEEVASLMGMTWDQYGVFYDQMMERFRKRLKEMDEEDQ